jgi:3-methyl-2-oxobutanoate hydroxymethyltransferase
VGDSLANVVLGLDQTRRVSLKEMLNHTEAVARGVKNGLVVADMPYASYQKHPEKCVYYAKKFIDTGAAAVKVEWFDKCPYVVENLIKHKIPVMGHIGLTPQTVHLLGGYKVQGKDKNSADKLVEQAKILQDLGVFSIVLECIPYQVSRNITQNLRIPTIGIGAGKFCDGQVLVLYDFLGLYGKKLKFVRVYKDLYSDIKNAVSQFIKDIGEEDFPSEKESFSL